jgi:hypothetical protein
MSEDARHYSMNGVLTRPFANTLTLQRLNALCREIFEGRIKKGYKEKVHYEGMARDVGLNHNYDPVLLDILFENDLPRLMQEVVGPNAVLYNINAITSIPPGYVTFWHSDEQARPVHKVFYYPVFDNDADPCLEVIPGHFRSLWRSRSRILTNRYSSWIEATLSRKQMITSSNENFVVLNTCVMHRAVPVTKPSGVFRLMYSFVDWFKDEDERRRITALPYTPIRINDEIVKHYSSRITSRK